MKRLLVAAAIIGSVRLQADDPIRVLKLRNNVSMVQTPGGNITVLAFPEGVTLVDSGAAPMADKVLAAVRTLSPQPIRYIINTSADPDHVGGNDKLSLAGQPILAAGYRRVGLVGRDYAPILAEEHVMNRMGEGLGINARGQSLVDAVYLSLGYTSNASGAWIK